MNTSEPPRPPQTHRLRSRQADFTRYLNGTRTFEVRAQDRGYYAGDTLELVEFVPCTLCNGSKKTQTEPPRACSCCYTEEPAGRYSGRALRVQVTHVVLLPALKGGLRNLLVLGVTRPPSKFGYAQVRAWADRFNIPCQTDEDVARLQEAMLDCKDRPMSMVEVLHNVPPPPPLNRADPG